MAGRWETLILLVCELPVFVCAETVGRLKEDVGDEAEEVCRCISLCMALKWKKKTCFQMKVRRIMG